ncbi:hypothetical protein [Cohnella laeviribosi]|uniref:hypothetical protein n=1 Tax=Cohnella laeviribosi TaxID=380174 RepID=UPI003D226F64
MALPYGLRVRLGRAGAAARGELGRKNGFGRQAAERIASDPSIRPFDRSPSRRRLVSPVRQRRTDNAGRAEIVEPVDGEFTGDR